ncbi:N2,N2-dimethylguanosine tRNA methyltransferase-domain-containing protein [Melanogaster broomeanus]|nr:N2,N2-dimethylguanosine tRNA methyltransferase-domain-containing protein [Melanogaster broomeanus]
MPRKFLQLDSRIVVVSLCACPYYNPASELVIFCNGDVPISSRSQQASAPHDPSSDSSAAHHYTFPTPTWDSRLHTENDSHILLSSKDEAFLNPVQEFNRDVSVACIRVWSEEMDREKKEKWTEVRRAAREEACSCTEGEGEGEASQSAEPVDPARVHYLKYHPYKFVLLEALSATGLRSIRFVIANDISPSATDAMRRNVELNSLGPAVEENEGSGTSNTGPDEQTKSTNLGKVRINEGDACALLYNHRTEKTRVDVVDLDPYGTAAPFIDAAVQAINDGGLLCVTCTDLSVLATTNYSEKCFSNYGGMPVKTEYCHEVALRLVLNTISTSASRYGRYIEPVLSLSIDFYVRLFVRIRTGPFEVKKAASKTSIYYVCQGCSSFHEQKIGRIYEQVNENTEAIDQRFKTVAGPPVSSECSECGFSLHRPMWSGPLHNVEFVSKVLEHVNNTRHQYGTWPRMKGMLAVAQEELDVPFFFTPGKVAGTFHCSTPALDDVASALLNAGYKVSRSHACAGSLKTTASHEQIHDVFRSWVKIHPVRMDRISHDSPSFKLLSKEPQTTANFKRHPGSVTRASEVNLVRYQQNPKPFWGPGSKAGGKRKRSGGRH